jgi:hypothetical protein
MKYLKTYEENLDSSIKKYSIIEYKFKSKLALFIIELVNTHEDSLDVRLHYRYIKHGNKLVKESPTVTRLKDLDQYNVLISSDNLQDCLDYINTTMDQNKYNL